MAKRRPLIFKSVLLVGIAAIVLGKSAFCDDVKITTYYPTPYGEYKNVKAHDSLTAGSASIASSTKVNGNITVNNGNMTVVNSFFRVAPDKGPYGADGFRVTRSTGNVAIGSNISYETTARLKVHTALAGRNLYALDYNSLLFNKKYGEARGFTDLTQGWPAQPTQPWQLRNKAQFRAMLDNGTPNDFTDDTQYAPLRVDGYYVSLGPKMVDRGTDPTNPGLYYWQGFMNNVLIGTQTPDASVQPDRLFLQVGDPGDGTEARGNFSTYSSREFKTDVMPFSRTQYKDALTKIVQTPVWHYHFKADPKNRKTRIGVMAENSPREIVTADGKALSLSDTFGFLAAALKELKARNDVLKQRLDTLEKRQLELQLSKE